MVRRVVLALVLALGGFALGGGPAHAYGGGAGHDVWQLGVSFNCNNPDFCGEDLGGFWGWVEFDRWADGSITGDGEFAGCGHTVGGGGKGSAGAGHIEIDILAAHIAPGGPDDPPGVDVFWIDSNEVTFTFGGDRVTVDDDPEFLGDSGLPAVPGHYPLHPAPGVAGEVQVSYRAAR
jgi:hypothetical protein